MRGVRGVGLVLVDERGRGVALRDRRPRSTRARVSAMKRSWRRKVVGGAELAVGAQDQRIVGLQRDVDRAVAALW